MADPLGDVLQRSGDHDPAVGEPEQHDVGEVLVEDLVDDVADVGGEVDLRAHEVDPLADAREARGEHLVALGGQEGPDLAEPVRPTPRTVHQHERRHAQPSGAPTAGRPARAWHQEVGRRRSPPIGCRPERTGGCNGSSDDRAGGRARPHRRRAPAERRPVDRLAHDGGRRRGLDRRLRGRFTHLGHRRQRRHAVADPGCPRRDREPGGVGGLAELAAAEWLDRLLRRPPAPAP